MTVKAFNEFSNPDLFFYQKGGVYVNGIRRPGNASRSGLRQQDILVKLNSQPVKTVADVKKIYDALLADKKRKPRVLMQIRRGALTQLIVLDYKEDFSK